MKKTVIKKLLLGALLASCSAAVFAQAPFGGEDDVAFAAKLWQSMQDQNLVGEKAIMSTPYVGAHPHGAILDTIDTRIKVGDEEGVLIIKRNYGGEGVSKSAVADNPDKFLAAITIMLKRKGYDPDNKDWYWAKYGPDGSVMKNPKNMSLAGRVAKGAPKGCIACHTAAPGNDLVFNNNKYK
jgi:hypothetical protein